MKTKSYCKHNILQLISQCREYPERNFDLICLEKPVKDLVVTSLSMLMLGYSGGLDRLASSGNLKCI